MSFDNYLKLETAENETDGIGFFVCHLKIFLNGQNNVLGLPLNCILDNRY